MNVYLQYTQLDTFSRLHVGEYSVYFEYVSILNSWNIL